MKIKFFELAKKLSFKSDYENHKLGAVIVKGNTIQSTGFNKNRTHRKSPHPFKKLHAEVCAIINSKKPLSGCSIYVYRETKEGIPAMSRPCKYCYQLIKKQNIKYIYYSHNGHFYEEKVT